MSALDRISVAAIGTSVPDLEAETLRAEAAGVECVWAPELFRSAVTQAATARPAHASGGTASTSSLPWSSRSAVKS